MENIIVTGGAGYIGSHICKAVRGAGMQPVTVDDLSRGFEKLVKWGPLERGDITNEAWLSAALAKWKPKAVIHCAGLISVGESVTDPDPYYHHNVTGTLTLLRAMRSAGVAQLIFSSSCAVHGHPPELPLREDAPFAPLSPYGRSKLAAEYAITDAARAYGLSAAILRYFNAAGADPAGEAGELHEPETHLIPLALLAAESGGAFHLYGTDYSTPDGTAVRDYIHVTDLAQAHVQALALLTKPGTQVMNIGTGQGHSVQEVLRVVESVTGKKVNVQHHPRREGDPPMLVADNNRARSLLGFSPTHSSLTTIVQTAWQWHSRSGEHV